MSAVVVTVGPVERSDDARLMEVDVRTPTGSTGWTVWADADGWRLGDVGDECPALAAVAGTSLGRTARAARTAIRRLVLAVAAEELVPVDRGLAKVNLGRPPVCAAGTCFASACWCGRDR